MPRLSIIIPTFNAGACIEKCLNSMGRQTFRDFEVIVQDGLSSDETLEQIEHFRNANAQVDVKVFAQEDKGPYDAMNKGIRHARGEWFYFLGSDDELHDPNALAAVFQFADFSKTDIIYGNVKVVGDASWAKDGSVYDGIFDRDKLLNRNICHQAIFYRAEFFRNVGEYNIDYAVCADWDFNMRCWSKTTFEYVDVVVANFRTGGVSVGGADEAFRKEVASNVLKYFRLSVYDAAVNKPTFAGFGEIVKMQQSRMSLHRIAGRIRAVVARSFTE